MNMKFSKRVCTAVLVSCTLSFTALAAKTSDSGQIQQLNEKITQIQTQLDAQSQTLATLGNQVNEVVSRFQMMSGQVGAVDKKNLDQDNTLKESDQRLQILEDKALGLMSQLQELKDEGFLKPKSVKNFEEYKNYSMGLERFNARDYAKAATELRKFQQTNKDSLYWGYAQFWIGESYYMQADYLTAIQEYQNLIKDRPKSAKVPLALYRQGMSFVQLQSFEDAKAFFAKLVKTFPQTIEATMAEGQIARIDRILELQKQQEIELKAVQ